MQIDLRVVCAEWYVRVCRQVPNFVSASQNLVKGLEMSASVYNLFDQDYGDPASRFHQQDIIERDGRTFRLKLTYRF